MPNQINVLFNLPLIHGRQVAWPSGLRRWFKAPVSSEAWVRIPPLPLIFLLSAFFFFPVISDFSFLPNMAFPILRSVKCHKIVTKHFAATRCALLPSPLVYFAVVADALTVYVVISW